MPSPAVLRSSRAGSIAESGGERSEIGRRPAGECLDFVCERLERSTSAVLRVELCITGHDSATLGSVAATGEYDGVVAQVEVYQIGGTDGNPGQLVGRLSGLDGGRSLIIAVILVAVATFNFVWRISGPGQSVS